MNDIVKEIFRNISKTDSIYKKINLLNRKKDRMGLTEDEEFDLKELKIKYFIVQEEIISDIVGVVLERIMNESALSSFQKIQELIPWKGRLLIHSQEVDDIMDAIEKLDQNQINEARKELKNMHRQIFLAINDACQDEYFLDSFERLGVMISGDKDGGIMDSLSYIDTIYKEFGELINANLDEVIVDFEEE